MVSGDNESNFQNLSENNKEITIHQRNLQVLMIEVYKIINGYAPPIMDNFFIFRENTHNLRNFQIILKTKSSKIWARRQYPIEHLSSGQISQRNTNSQILSVNLNRKLKLGHVIHVSVRLCRPSLQNFRFI